MAEEGNGGYRADRRYIEETIKRFDRELRELDDRQRKHENNLQVLKMAYEEGLRRVKMTQSLRIAVVGGLAGLIPVLIQLLVRALLAGSKP